MPKSVSANLQDHLDGEVTTMASILEIIRTDGTDFHFTSHDEDIIYQTDTYVSIGAYTATSVQTATGLSIDRLDLEAVLDSAGLNESDLISGLFDFASFQVSDINYESIGDGIIIQRAGILGAYSHGAPEVELELRGLIQFLHQRIGRLFMKRCDADLGDARCNLPGGLGPHTVTGKVTSFSSRQTFIVDTPVAARGGLFTWTSGANNGLKMEVRNSAGSTIFLAQPMPYDIAVDDDYSVYRGCDKRASTCEDPFDNIANFRGFPFLPGTDEIYRYPDAK